MLRYLIRRLALIPPILLLANFIGFAYARLAQRVQLARNPFLALESTDLPLFQDYGTYLGGLLRFDLGLMPRSEQTILDAMWQAGQNTLGLLAIAFVISLALGILLGYLATSHEPIRTANWLTALNTLGLALPSFYAGSLLIVASLFYALLSEPGTLPPLPLQGFGWDVHLVMPVIALCIRPTVQIARFTATMLSGELSKQYVVVSRAHGHTWRDVRWRLSLRNIMAPMALNIAGALRMLVVEVVVVEWLFGWKGIGRLFAQTLVQSNVISTGGQSVGVQIFLNAYLLAPLVMSLVGIFLITDLLASVFGQWIDPRLQLAEQVAEGLNG